MKRCILTPTYRGHFEYIRKYLFSIEKYVLDRDFPIRFIVDEEDKSLLEEIVVPYTNELNIGIITTEEIFNKFGILEKPSIVLQKYGRLSFQTLKKLYGCLFLDYEQYLIVDSESLFVKEISLNDEFDNYFEKKYVFYSDFNDRPKEYFGLFTYNFIVTASYVLGIKPSCLTLESYHWFYDKRIIEDIIRRSGDIFCMVKNVRITGEFHDEGLIDSLLYYMFIREHNKEYNYNFVNVNKVLNNYMGKKEYYSFLKQFNKSFRKHGGYLEGIASFVTEMNLTALKSLVSDYKLPLFRVSKIISKDMKCLDEEMQMRFVNESSIKLLTSSYPDIFFEQVKRGNRNEVS